MCGIIGYIGNSREGQWGQTYRLLRELFLSSEHRGHDATGFVAQTEPLDRPFDIKTLLSKSPTTSSRFVEKDAAFRRLRHQRCSAFIGHVRAATHGDPKAADNINNHPFVGRDGLFLVHNGVVGNHEEVADKYALTLKSDCDSEVILRLVETTDNPIQGVRLALKECDGSMAIAVFDARRQLIYLARNQGRPLWLSRLRRDQRWYFASTDQIITTSLKMVMGSQSLQKIELLFPLAEETVHILSPDGSFLAAG